MIMRSKCKGDIEQRVSIVHVDDADLHTSGENCETKMQDIISYFMKINKTTGGKVQKEKVLMCCCKQENQKTTNEPMSIKLKIQLIKQAQVNESIKKVRSVHESKPELE